MASSRGSLLMLRIVCAAGQRRSKPHTHSATNRGGQGVTQSGRGGAGVTAGVCMYGHDPQAARGQKLMWA